MEARRSGRLAIILAIILVIIPFYLTIQLITNLYWKKGWYDGNIDSISLAIVNKLKESFNFKEHLCNDKVCTGINLGFKMF